MTLGQIDLSPKGVTYHQWPLSLVVTSSLPSSERNVALKVPRGKTPRGGQRKLVSIYPYSQNNLFYHFNYYNYKKTNCVAIFTSSLKYWPAYKTT